MKKISAFDTFISTRMMATLILVFAVAGETVDSVLAVLSEERMVSLKIFENYVAHEMTLKNTQNGLTFSQ